MREEIKETIKILQSNPLVKCGSYEFIGDSNITYAEIYILLELIRTQEQENRQLKEQVEYLRRSCERKEDTIISLEQDLTIIDELEKWCKSFTTEEFNYNFLVVRIKDVLDKISELKGEKNE